MPKPGNLPYEGDEAALENSSAIASPLVGQSIFGGQFSPPVALIKRSAIDHNAAWMKGFTTATGSVLAPHGKTSMSPEIFGWQLEQGARWLTVASVAQARIARQAGANHILIANQVINAPDLDYLVQEMDRDDSLSVVHFVDSLAGVRLAADAMIRNNGRRPLEVMLEVGITGGRAGVRDLRSALEVGRAVSSAAGLALVGVAGYEGVFSPREDDAIGKVDRYLDTIVATAEACAAEGCFTGPQITLSAGGSKFFDRVAACFSQARLDRPVEVQLRCGCYLFHDIGIYAEAMDLMAERSSVAAQLAALRPALEIWATVQSRPEPGRAIVNMGRRDVSFDAGLPVPHMIFRPGGRRPKAISAPCTLVKLNDQHGFLDVSPALDLEVGDVVGFGISHPCTFFDKWDALYVINDDYVVTQIAHTCFS
ncbi:MAG TPA: alanine racemase [Devosia sp.]|nr:alanine racemase [Devosia sp.]